MSLTKFNIADAAKELGVPTAVPAPIGEPVSHIQSNGWLSNTVAGTKIGLWECTPGRWVRQVRQAEFCHFLSGTATFTPESSGEPIPINPGDVIHFPENSAGIWEVTETTRKIFMVYNESNAG